jgi:hypothetical protein
MEGDVVGGNEKVIVLDTLSGPFAPPIALDLPGGRRVWVVDHVRETARERDIRFFRSDKDIPAVIGRIPNPYVTPFAADALSPSEVLIAGGVLDSAEQVVSSVLLRVRLACTAGSP